MQQLIKSIYDLRIHIDAQIQFNTQKLNRTSETTRSLRSLELAKGWLGKALYFLNETTPYKPAHKTEDIPETADTAPIKTKYQDAWDEIYPSQLNYINDAREVIGHLLQRWEKLNKNYGSISLSGSFRGKYSWINARHALRNTFTHLHEASMNLGFELARLRNENMNTPPLRTDAGQGENPVNTSPEKGEIAPEITFHITGRPDTEWGADLHPALKDYMTAKQTHLKALNGKPELGKGPENAFKADNGISIWWEVDNQIADCLNKFKHIPPSPNKPIDADSNDSKNVYIIRNICMKLDYDTIQKDSIGAVIAATLIHMGREMNARLARGEDSPFYGEINPYIHPRLNTKAWIKDQSHTSEKRQDAPNSTALTE